MVLIDSAHEQDYRDATPRNKVDMLVRALRAKNGMGEEAFNQTHAVFLGNCTPEDLAAAQKIVGGIGGARKEVKGILDDTVQ